MLSTMSIVHLVDASPYIFRAYFSLPESMTDPNGQPINAVYGFANFLIKYIDDEQPTHLGVAFDESLNTSFRNEIYPEYKAQRELPPAELEAQQKACQEVARALGARTWVHDRYEADDLIAAACSQLRAEGHGCVVVSSDKDLSQLVDDETVLFDYAREQRYGPGDVAAKFGVRPDQIADYLGLAGDSVDNIPGVKGVGPKTACALLDAFPNLEALYTDLESVATLSVRGAKSLAAKLEREKDMAFLSRELATVARDAPADAKLEELEFRGADRSLLEPLLERLGIDRMLTRVRHWAEEKA